MTIKNKRSKKVSGWDLSFKTQAEKEGITFEEAKKRCLKENAERRNEKIQAQAKIPNELPEGLLKLVIERMKGISDEKEIVEAFALLPEMKKLSAEIDRLKGEIFEIEVNDGVDKPIWNIHHSNTSIRFGQDKLEGIDSCIQDYLDGKELDEDELFDIQGDMSVLKNELGQFRWAVKELTAAREEMKGMTAGRI